MQHRPGFLIPSTKCRTFRRRPALRPGHLPAPGRADGAAVLRGRGGLPNLPARLAEIRSYAERLFDYRVIGTLAETDARESFTIPAERVGAKYTDEALEQMVRISGRYPYFIQEFGSAMWEVAQSSPFRPRMPRPRPSSACSAWIPGSSPPDGIGPRPGNVNIWRPSPSTGTRGRPPEKWPNGPHQTHQPRTHPGPAHFQGADLLPRVRAVPSPSRACPISSSVNTTNSRPRGWASAPTVIRPGALRYANH